MRLKYQVVKELCQLMTDARIKIRDTKNPLESLKKLKWSAQTSPLTLKDYQFHLTDVSSVPNTILLDEAINKLHTLISSKSKLADFDELNSDMQWLQEYYEAKSWNDVTRWLTNIDSTLRETFSCYMKALKDIRGNDNFKTSKN